MEQVFEVVNVELLEEVEALEEMEVVEEVDLEVVEERNDSKDFEVEETIQEKVVTDEVVEKKGLKVWFFSLFIVKWLCDWWCDKEKQDLKKLIEKLLVENNELRNDKKSYRATITVQQQQLKDKDKIINQQWSNLTNLKSRQVVTPSRRVVRSPTTNQSPSLWYGQSCSKVSLSEVQLKFLDGTLVITNFH